MIRISLQLYTKIFLTYCIIHRAWGYSKIHLLNCIGILKSGFSIDKKKVQQPPLPSCGMWGNRCFALTQSYIHIFDINTADLYLVAAIGCPDPVPPENGYIDKDEQHTFIRCNGSDDVSWEITCRHNKWHGEFGNCSKGDDAILHCIIKFRLTHTHQHVW